MNPDTPVESESVSKVEQVFLKGLLILFAFAIVAIALIFISRSITSASISQKTAVLSPLSQETPQPTP